MKDLLTIIDPNEKNLVIFRGLPGSGKTTRAEKLQKETGWFHIESNFFFEVDGKYLWQADMVRSSHQWCGWQMQRELFIGNSVIVANCFNEMWEMKFYFEQAERFGAKITVVECEGSYGNPHEVPEETLAKMAKKRRPLSADFMEQVHTVVHD